MKYEAILENNSSHSVRKMCKVLGVKEKSYYQWRRRREKNKGKTESERQLVKQVREEFEKTRRVYGYRKMKRHLDSMGIQLSEYKVRNIMRKNGMYPVTLRGYRPGKGETIREAYAGNELARHFKAEEPHKILTGGITYIRTDQGWVYLAVVPDLYNRKSSAAQ